MKQFLFLLTFALPSSYSFAQLCDSLVSPCVSTFSRNGYYFDLEAVNASEIQGFSFQSQNAGTRDIAVYYRAGTYFGNETNASAWTLLGNFPNYTPNSALNCPLPNNTLLFAGSVCIPQGQRYGFYFQMTSGVGTIESHNTLTEGSIGAQDANLKLITGKGQFGIGPAFTGTLLSGLTYQGVIQYACSCQSVTIEEPLSVAASILFPNPANTELFVTLPESGTAEVDAIDAAGRTVIPKTSISPEKNSIHVANLASGIYFLRVYRQNSGFTYHRFIKS